MIKSVFIDFYDTVVDLDPPRQELQARACSEFDITIDPSGIPRGYFIANDFLSRENARQSIQKRSPEKLKNFWGEYESIILKHVGVEVSRELAFQIFSRMRQLDRRFVLFEDVLPTVKMLKDRGLILGLISNLDRTLDSYCNELGLTPYIDFTLVSYEVGEEKPHPKMFLTALERAGVGPSEAIHVGDQYQSDVLGARGVNIRPLLLDRLGFWEDINDCQRIRSLTEIVDYL